MLGPMGYDPTVFARHYVGELPRAVPGTAWQLTAVQAERARAAIDLVASRPGATLVVYVETRHEGIEALARTRDLALSYYPADGVQPAEAAAVVRAVAQLCAEREQASPASGLRREDAGPEALPRTVELRINRECNEACAFCNTPPSYPAILAGPDAVLAALSAEYAAGYRGVTFTGREPTLDRALPSYVARARELGYRRIGIQTNGTTLSATLDRLCDAGLTSVDMSLHTLSPEIFEALVGKPSLLAHALAGLDALRRRPELEVSIIVVLTELNLATLPELVTRVIELVPHVHGVTASPMAPVGDGGRPEVRHLIPRLGSLAEPLAAAQAITAAAGVLFNIPSRCGLPLCVIPASLHAHNEEWGNAPDEVLAPGKRKAPSCASCAWSPRCTGVWSAVLDAQGDGDLRPFATSPRP